MKSGFRHAVVAAAVAAWMAPSALAGEAGEPLSWLGWLAGTWAATDDSGAVSEEQWLPPRGGTLIGVNRLSQGGETLFFELLRIAAEDGKVIYYGAPLGGPATPFTMTAGGEGFAVFENPAHDFPQKISYRRDGDTLTATVSGPGEGGEASESWVWTRVSKP